MRLPVDVDIPQDKLTRYLLVPRRRNDKAKFLRRAGFTRENPALLENAIRSLVATEEAVEDRKDNYGTFYRVTGVLAGPTGDLEVITVWLRATATGRFRFITLKPAR